MSVGCNGHPARHSRRLPLRNGFCSTVRPVRDVTGTQPAMPTLGLLRNGFVQHHDLSVDVTGTQRHMRRLLCYETAFCSTPRPFLGRNRAPPAGTADACLLRNQFVQRCDLSVGRNGPNRPCRRVLLRYETLVQHHDPSVDVTGTQPAMLTLVYKLSIRNGTTCQWM